MSFTFCVPQQIYYSGDQIKTGHVERIGDSRGALRVLVRKPEKRRPLARPRHRWEDNIKMDLK